MPIDGNRPKRRLSDNVQVLINFRYTFNRIEGKRNHKKQALTMKLNVARIRPFCRVYLARYQVRTALAASKHYRILDLKSNVTNEILHSIAHRRICIPNFWVSGKQCSSQVKFWTVNEILKTKQLCPVINKLVDDYQRLPDLFISCKQQSILEKKQSRS